VGEIMISYAITVCNELLEIQNLVKHLLTYIDLSKDEIIILQDYDEYNPSKVSVHQYLKSLNHPSIKTYSSQLNNHFANFKNELNSYCNSKYIFQIDADEIPHSNLLINLHYILESNPEVDLFRIPRVNVVDGISEYDLKNWGWTQNSDGWINWPDYQSRIYKRCSKVHWIRPVHETIVGIEKLANLPADPDFALFHTKNIDKQRAQNNYYNKL